MDDDNYPKKLGFEKVYSDELQTIGLRRDRLKNGKTPEPGFVKNSQIADGEPDVSMQDLTGLCLSGGGIRSSAFCLGAIQAMDILSIKPWKENATAPKVTLFDDIDYMSTVSGGGYTGAAITAAMTAKSEFPLHSALNKDESPTLQHIRDHSNYLFPKGGFHEIAVNLSVILRGILSHAPVIGFVFFLLVSLTVYLNPSISDLNTPTFIWPPDNWLGHLLGGIHASVWLVLAIIVAFFAFYRKEDDGLRNQRRGIRWGLCVLSAIAILLTGIATQQFLGSSATGTFQTTGFLLLVLVGMMISWGVIRSFSENRNFEIGRNGTWAAGALVVTIVVCGFMNLQPFLIQELHKQYQNDKPAVAETTSKAARTADLSLSLSDGDKIDLKYNSKLEMKPEEKEKAKTLFSFFNDPFRWIKNVIEKLSTWLTAIAGIVGTAAAFLGGGQATSQNRSGPLALLGGFSTKLALLLAGLALPFLLWYGYLQFSYWGILLNEWIAAAGPWLPGTEPILPPELPIVVKNSIHGLEGYTSHHGRIPNILVFITALLGLYCLLLRKNANSLHGLYKDRLSQAFLNCPLQTKTDEVVKFSRDIPLSEISEKGPPLHLINAALNIQGSTHVNKRGRNAGFFTFSRNHVGSGATGYVETKLLEEREHDVTLGSAMAISAAAASSAMGTMTIKPLSFTLAALNVRLGYWMRNPRCVHINGPKMRLRLEWSAMPLSYLSAEVTGRLDERSQLVYLTDGGHVENLGLYTLLKRRCRFIIVVDGEADPNLTYSSFVKAQRYARIDLGTRIVMPFDDVTTTSRSYRKWLDDAAKSEPNREGFRKSGPHCSLGEIFYPADKDGREQKGVILYLKSSISGDENDYVRDYAARNKSFPHETTGDQLFSEEQFEAYRSLGFHTMIGALKKDGNFVCTTRDKIEQIYPKNYKASDASDAVKAFREMYPSMQREN